MEIYFSDENGISLYRLMLSDNSAGFKITVTGLNLMYNISNFKFDEKMAFMLILF